MLHDEKRFPNPEEFIPERFLTLNGELNSDMKDAELPAFGFGRRICPGRFIADASLFATVATLLATVDVVCATDAQGNQIVPEVDVTPGLLSHPKPFP